MEKFILAFSREAGGAEAIIPVIKDLKKEDKLVLIFAKNYAIKNFKRHNLKIKELKANSYVELVNKLNKFKDKISFVFTSATSLPQNDMTEKYLWMWAKEYNILSLAVVDQWQNYALRFSGKNKNERLKYQPDFITAIDKFSKKMMIKEGLSEKKIFITGQPAFDDLRNYKVNKNNIKRKLGYKKGEILIVFISESLKRDVNYGYTEDQILKDILKTLDEIIIEKKCKIRLILKYHPQNIKEDFKGLDFNLNPNLKIVEIERQISPRDLIFSVDLVIGMASILLAESILLGKFTISYQKGANRKDLCMATILKSIPLILSKKELKEIIYKLLFDKKYKDQYLKQQKLLSFNGNAALKISKIILNLIK